MGIAAHGRHTVNTKASRRGLAGGVGDRVPTPWRAGSTGKQRESAGGGLREIGTSGKQLVLNGHPAFFRGTLECCIFPL